MNNNCSLSCIGGSAVISAIIGVISAVLRYNAVITITPSFLWVFFGIAVGFLAITLLTSSLAKCEQCCRGLNSVLLGIAGTIFCSVVLLGIEFAAISAFGTLLTALITFSFSFMLLSIMCLIRCRYNCD